MLTFKSSSAKETEKTGFLLGTLLDNVSCIALYGDLGGGKTCFTRGLVSSITPEKAHLVASPTFSIMNEYAGINKTIYHFDFYRLSGCNDIYDMGFDNYFTDNGICIIEWAERLEGFYPEDSITVNFVYVDETCRTLEFNATGNESHRVLQILQRNLKT